jgi:hypothetical protein
MGHWEQTGRDNAAERERRAAWPRWRRELIGQMGNACAAAMWGVIVLLVLRVIGAL